MSVTTTKKELGDFLCLRAHGRRFPFQSKYERLQYVVRFVAQDARPLNVILGDRFLTIAHRLVDVGESMVQLTLKG